MSKTPNCLSIVIITYNEAKNLTNCLYSALQIADEVLVIDAFSTDDTPKIAAHFGVRFEQRQWKNFSDAKNYGNSLATYPWILSLDADEVLSDALVSSIRALKETGFSGVYSLDRWNNYYGHFLKHSGVYPDYKPRLFHKNEAYWHGDFVHETLKTSEKPQKIKGALLHYSIKDVGDHLLRLHKYSDLEADMLFLKGKKSGVLPIVFAPIVKFLKTYFWHLGILDGVSGLVVSVMVAYGRFLRYAKLYYKWQNAGDKS